LLDGGAISDQYGIPSRSVPTLFWIDRAGVIVDVDAGSGNPKVLVNKTKALLSKS